jgi:serine/threonine protein kinase
MAPEVLAGEEYDSTADIWSLGAIIYKMLVGEMPFKAKSHKDLANKHQLGKYSVPKSLSLSIQSIDFIQRCLRYEPKDRITYEKLPIHPFITGDASDA